MLLSYSLENFRSFRDRSELSLYAASIRESPENVYQDLENLNFRVLKSCGLFGANASGKSNFILSLAFAKSLITDSIYPGKGRIGFRLEDAYDEKETKFEFSILIEKEKYRYGFSILGKLVVTEYLFISRVTKEELLFLRSQHGYSFGNRLKKDFGSKLSLYSEMCKPDVLFIKALANFNNELGIRFQNWFSRIIFFQDEHFDDWVHFTANLLHGDEFVRNSVNRIIKNSDLGIEKVVEKLNPIGLKASFSNEFLQLIHNISQNEFIVNTIHSKINLNNGNKSSEYFDLLQDESAGTIKLFSLLGPLLFAIKNQSILVIDEMDSKFHSLLLENLFIFFNKSLYSNIGSQLIFSSHNLQLIKRQLRRDQILLFERNDLGATSFNSLHKKYPNVRNDASFEKDYLQGKYDAIPKSGEQLSLF